MEFNITKRSTGYKNKRKNNQIGRAGKAIGSVDYWKIVTLCNGYVTKHDAAVLLAGNVGGNAQRCRYQDCYRCFRYAQQRC